MCISPFFHLDGCRPETTYEGLSKLPPVFQKGGSTTAGIASQVSDGAAAVLVTSRAYAQKHGLPILGTLRSFAVAGTPPEVRSNTSLCVHMSCLCPAFPVLAWKHFHCKLTTNT